MGSKAIRWFPGVLMLTLLGAGKVFGFTAGPDPNLVGWWTLDEGQGTTAYDSSGNANTGVVRGSAVWAAGHLGGALQFDGTSTSVLCGNDRSLQIRNQITLACWLKTPGFTKTWAALITKGDTAWRLSRSSETGDSIHFGLNGTVAAGNPWFDASKSVTDNEWHHVAGTYDGTLARIYLDGVSSASLAVTGQINASASNVLLGDNEGSPGRYFTGILDDVRIYKRGLTAEEVRIVMKGYAGPIAEAPAPKDQATDVLRDGVLAWMPGPGAQTHDVYLGTVFADVNTAARTSPKGVLVSQDQADATYVPTTPLTFGQTYYWRVDEVNYAADPPICRGQVWSFTAEPYAYPVRPIKATASSASTPSMGPEKTIDGSGLNAQDQHATTSSAMWLSKTTPSPAWIQYEFDGPYQLYEMWVWNSNQSMEPYMGYGARDVTVEVSLDGTTWTALGGVPPFARATGKDGYAHNTTVDFGGVLARFVRLTVKKVWGNGTQAGLSEVRFFHVPVQAFGPQPADGATEVTVGTLLTWRPGREAAQHVVYLGTNAQALAEAGTVADHSFTPSLDLAQTYYWKVNEVNQAATTRTWEGKVWSFTTAAYLVIDDVEGYTNAEGHRVFDTWIDGWGTNTNGAQVGNTMAPFTEWTIVHGGSQSMPLMYSNMSATVNSEATRTFAPVQDWTRCGVKALALYFSGLDSNTTAVSLWVILTDQTGKSAKVTFGSVAGATAALASPAWTEWKIPLSEFGGVDLTKIESLTLGLGNGTGAGTLYFDDIRLTR